MKWILSDASGLRLSDVFPDYDEAVKIARKWAGEHPGIEVTLYQAVEIYLMPIGPIIVSKVE